VQRLILQETKSRSLIHRSIFYTQSPSTLTFWSCRRKNRKLQSSDEFLQSGAGDFYSHLSQFHHLHFGDASPKPILQSRIICRATIQYSYNIPISREQPIHDVVVTEPRPLFALNPNYGASDVQRRSDPIRVETKGKSAQNLVYGLNFSPDFGQLPFNRSCTPETYYRNRQQYTAPSYQGVDVFPHSYPGGPHDTINARNMEYSPRGLSQSQISDSYILKNIFFIKNLIINSINNLFKIC